MTIRKVIKLLLPVSFRRKMRRRYEIDCYSIKSLAECDTVQLSLYLKWLPYYRILKSKICHCKRIQNVRRRKIANVSFVVSSLSMWRSQGLVNILSRDGRFNISIILIPFSTWSREEQLHSQRQLCDFFDSCGIDYVDASAAGFNDVEWIKSYKPDILFYQQPFSNYKSLIDWSHNKYKLICYIPYGLTISQKKWSFNNYMTNIGWRIFYPNCFEVQLAKKECFNKGSNIINVGDIHYELINNSIHDPWLNFDPGHKKKRIIWAPHYSVLPDGVLNFDSFLWLAEFFMRYAKENVNKVVIGFKPHPKLRNDLKRHNDWGVEKTELFFEEFSSLSNVFYESGEYCDLFAHADAIIHDSGSFIGEALYADMPCCYTARDLNKNLDSMNDFARASLNNYYIASDLRSVEEFIKSVVFGENDYLRSRRIGFKYDYLAPKNEGVNCNIYRELCKGLGWEAKDIN